MLLSDDDDDTDDDDAIEINATKMVCCTENDTNWMAVEKEI